MVMTAKERLIMDLIRENPSVSQEQLAKKAGMSRAAVSVHISNLMKKGYISGRGYILEESPFVAVVGGANIDIIGYSKDKIGVGDSNPGKVRTTPGGVGRNIAENLARMGVDTKLITAIGEDSFGQQTYQETQAAGVDMQHIYYDAEYRHSAYMAMLDNNGALHTAISDMEMVDHFSLEHVQQKRNVISRAAYVVVDCNLSTPILEMVLDASTGPVYLDAVSASKSRRAKPLIGRFDTIKVNQREAQALSGMRIEKEDDIRRVTDGFLATGVRRIVLTLGEHGVFWKSRMGEGFSPHQPADVKNVTGGGDSFTAGLLYSAFHNIEDSKAIAIAECVSRLTLQSDFSVSRSITPSRMRYFIEKSMANAAFNEHDAI